MTPDAYAWPEIHARNLAAFKHELETPMRGHNAICCRLAADNAELRARITDLEHQANTLAACLIHALTDQPNREPNSQGDQT